MDIFLIESITYYACKIYGSKTYHHILLGHTRRRGQGQVPTKYRATLENKP